MSRLLSPLVAALFTAAATGQCAYTTMAANAYGSSCGGSSATSPFLSVYLDAPGCRLQFGVNGTGSGPHYQLAGWLAIGTQPVNVPFPALGPGCTLLTSGDLYLSAAAWGTASLFDLPLPATPLPPITLYAQGGSLVVVPSSSGPVTVELRLTFGRQVDLQ